MKTYTFSEILKIIPLEENTRKKLISEYEGYSDDLKLEIQRICWSSFAEMKELLLSTTMERIKNNVKLGDTTVEFDLRAQAENVLEQLFDDILSGKMQESDQMDEIRTKLKAIAEQSKLQELVNKADAPTKP